MKITLKDDSVFEGTAEEYAEIMRLGAGESEIKDEYVPKVGDKVRALTDSEFRDIKKDETGTVTGTNEGISEYDEHTIQVETDTKDCFFRPQDLELVSEKVEEKATIEFGGKKYAEVDRKAKVGDLVEYGDGRMKLVKAEIGGELCGDGARENSWAIYGVVCPIKVYEPVESKYVPQEGDIVVITGNTNRSRNIVGDIGKVDKNRISGGVQVDVPSRPHSFTVNGNYTKYEEMRPATEEERKKYERELAKTKFIPGDYARVTESEVDLNKGDIVEIVGNGEIIFDFKIKRIDGYETHANATQLEKIDEEDVKFAKLGRKPGELKKGDLVRYKVESEEKGMIVEVVGDTVEGRTKVFFNGTPWGICTERNADLKLITPVERRVDIVD